MQNSTVPMTEDFEVLRAVSMIRRCQGLTQRAAITELVRAAAASGIPLFDFARLVNTSDEAALPS